MKAFSLFSAAISPPICPGDLTIYEISVIMTNSFHQRRYYVDNVNYMLLYLANLSTIDFGRQRRVWRNCNLHRRCLLSRTNDVTDDRLATR